MTTTCTKVNFQIKKLYEDSQLPKKAHETDACYDIYSYSDVVIPPFTTVKIGTGICTQFPFGYKMHLYTRSGLGAKGIQIANCPGVIDYGYTGEIIVALYNSTPASFQVLKGDRIGQIALERVVFTDFDVVDEFTETERGDNGFASTGR